MSALGSSFQRAPRVSWTPDYEGTFFRSLWESVLKGLRDNATGTLKSEAWAKAAHDLWSTHNVRLEKNHLKNKADNARKRFKAWRGLRDNPAFKYNEANSTVSASDEAWEEHLQKDPSAKPLRGRSFEHEKYFEIIFEDLLPNGIPRQRRRRLGDGSDGDLPGTAVVDLASEQQQIQSQEHQSPTHPPQQQPENQPQVEAQSEPHSRFQSQSQPKSHMSPHNYCRPLRSQSPQRTRPPQSPSSAASMGVPAQRSAARHLAPALTPPHDHSQSTDNSRKRSLSAESTTTSPQRRRTDSWGHTVPQSEPMSQESSSSALMAASPATASTPASASASTPLHSHSHYIHAHPPHGHAHPYSHAHSHHGHSHQHPPHSYPHRHHHHVHNHSHSIATPPSTIATTSPSTSISLPVASLPSVAGSVTTTVAIEEMLAKIIDASKSQQQPPVSRWTEQAMDIFFADFSNEDNDLQLMIAQKMLSVETTAMMFCKMSPDLRCHWVRRMRAPSAPIFQR
ncbi:hypothetical protein Cpir12675_004568 [Ceratocystis pirilliformis]|uniref:Myb/SANT-like domain-containing protein n=1 Tax=Ceratocystis pirilliformis TaxID=259994 RepID=A0ABR3YWH4_9PEZI